MNTLNRVYSKLNNKTELATHKVELALRDDAKKATASLIDDATDLGEYTRAILNAQGGLTKGIEGVRGKYEKVRTIIKKYKVKLKELGLTSSDVPLVKNMENAILATEKKVKRFEKEFLEN